jgi:hypothetical protein
MEPILDAPTGGWEYFSSSPVPSADQKTIYVGSGDGHLYALATDNGQLRWKHKTPRRIRATPFLDNGLLYQPSNDGWLYVLDADSGALAWKFETQGANMDSRQAGFDRNSIFDQPSREGDLLVFGARDGNVYGVDLSERKAKWNFSYGTTWAMSSTIADQTVYVGWSTNNLISAHDLQSGEEKWKFNAGSHVYTTPLVLNKSVYFGSASGSFYRLRQDSGEPVWSYEVGREIYGSPVHHDGTFFFGADDGVLYAVTEGVPAYKAVYLPDSIRGNARYLVVDPKLAPYLVERNFRQLDSASLYRFLSDRIADRAPSVVVFALPIIPESCIGEQPANGLLRQYLNSGGKIIWMGDIPNYYEPDASGNFKRDPTTGMQLLDVAYNVPRESGNYYSRATQAGRNWGLPPWLKTTASIVAPAKNIQPLAFDEDGRIGAWIKSFHPNPNSGFISCRTWAWNVPIREEDLEIIHTLAIYGLE